MGKWWVKKTSSETRQRRKNASDRVSWFAKLSSSLWHKCLDLRLPTIACWNESFHGSHGGLIFLKHMEMFNSQMHACLYMITYVFPSISLWNTPNLRWLLTHYLLPRLFPSSNPIFWNFSQEVIDDPELDAVWDSFFPSTVPVVPEVGFIQVVPPEELYTSLGLTLSPTVMEVENCPKWKETTGGNHVSLPWLGEEG